jgi:cell division protein FtsQ
VGRLREWWEARGRRLAWGVLAIVVAASPWWARAVAARMDYFRVRRVEIEGLRFASPDVVRLRLRPDTTMSVWDDLEAYERRVEGHAQIRSVRVGRRLPGTLVVRVEENLPVALVQGETELIAYDAEARRLPVDPARTPVDLPVLLERDPPLLRLLGALHDSAPAIFSRISDVRRAGRDELVFHFASLPVRTLGNVTAARLAEIFPVEADLARRQARVAELDLRYRDQVIARLQ